MIILFSNLFSKIILFHFADNQGVVMNIYIGALALSYASSSDAYLDLDFDELSSEQLEDSEYNYSHQLDVVTGLLIVIIFALGVVSGLVFSKIMWGRIK